MLFVILLLCILGSSTSGTGQAQYKPIFIDCGSNSSMNLDGRVWVGDDIIPRNNFTLTSPGFVISTTTIDDNSSYSPLYRTARIFNTTSYYNISVFPGCHFVRLHFYPFLFGNFNANDSSFDIMANNLKLVSKFNVPGEISWKSSRSGTNLTSLMKEYFLNISSNELSIGIQPSFGSFAFVNAIEVIPFSNSLSPLDSAFRVGSNSLKSSVDLSDRGMETMYRLNVGGPGLNPRDDQDLWRQWESDDSYMFSVNAAISISNTSNITYSSANDSFNAPLPVYETAREMTNNEVVEKRFNMSWRFDVDPNFDYLVRLHFCELFYDRSNQRVFRVYINNRTAMEEYDVFLRAGGKNKAYHDDFLDTVFQNIDTIWVQLGPDSLTSGADALLNGLEIFKLSRSGILAHVSGRFATGDDDSFGKNCKHQVLSEVIGASVVSAIILLVMCVLFFHYFIKKKKAILMKNSRPPGWQPLSLYEAMGNTKNVKNLKLSFDASNRTGRKFCLAEIKFATRNFDESQVIGTGGFGKVYKGEIDEGMLVAIKRANPFCDQGLAEFETEIEMLSKLRHRHLVSMIGYCDEKDEMILVYEYMSNGTLRSHLYGSGLPGLSWKQRLEACIGAARGLHYLHTGADSVVIHRDVKTTNILLDENFVAKMADFGLSKLGPEVDHTHVSTAVKGSFGYLDPEYYRRQQLTEKSDVYSFGVVLFEIVCARPVINPSLPKDQVNLAEWAIRWQRQRSLEAIVDHRLEGDYSRESLKKVGEIAEKCLADEGKSRPTMGEVLWHLEYALQLHEAYTQSEDFEHSCRSEMKLMDTSLSLPYIKEGEEEVNSFPEDATKGTDFPEILGPQGT